MTVYIIARMHIHDREAYNRYEEQFMDVFNAFDGKLLSVDESPTVLDGEWTATRSVLMEFPSKESAFAWLTSDAYQEISKHRKAGSTSQSVIMVNGLAP